MSDHGHDEPQTYGMLAEFDDTDKLVSAIQKARADGYTKMDAYTPYPVSPVIDALGFPKSEMGPIMFIGGLIGAACGFLMQYWTQAVDYPLNIAGRPLISWPAFIPVTFEMTILTASLSGLFGMIALCGLPLYHHPLFNSKTFERASVDRFFLCIEADDPKFDKTGTMAYMSSLGPISIEEVPV